MFIDTRAFDAALQKMIQAETDASASTEHLIRETIAKIVDATGCSQSRAVDLATKLIMRVADELEAYVAKDYKKKFKADLAPWPNTIKAQALNAVVPDLVDNRVIPELVRMKQMHEAARRPPQ